MHEEKFDHVLHMLNYHEKVKLTYALNKLGNFRDGAEICNFAPAFQEVMVMVLHRMAPNDDLPFSDYVHLDSEIPEVFVPVYRVMYAIRGQIMDEFIINELNIDIVCIQNNLERMIIHPLNQFDYTREEYAVLPAVVASQKSEQVVCLFARLLESIESIRNKLFSAYEQLVKDQLQMNKLDGILRSTRKLPPYSILQAIESNEVKVIGMKHNKLIFEITGKLTFTQQKLKMLPVAAQVWYGFRLTFRNDPQYPLVENIMIPRLQWLERETRTVPDR
ncbi:hypothetical protein [Paenibacillus wulumuqiensis]|uniref:hypothetical protein n=1 Tax=Paenibacillus wulumuqiensis TaxID=1567107 RepID=UPI000619AC5B|nr:hypothetical protein [Paenibacillus wulumuqiensis]